MLPLSLLVVHDTISGSEDEMAELTRWEKVSSELLQSIERDIESRRDHTALVKTTDEIHNNLARSVVIDDFKVTNVTVLLHDLKELDDNLGGDPHKDLSLAGLLGIDHSVKTVSEYTDANHPQRSIRKFPKKSGASEN